MFWAMQESVVEADIVGATLETWAVVVHNTALIFGIHINALCIENTPSPVSRLTQTVLSSICPCRAAGISSTGKRGQSPWTKGPCRAF